MGPAHEPAGRNRDGSNSTAAGSMTSRNASMTAGDVEPTGNMTNRQNRAPWDWHAARQRPAVICPFVCGALRLPIYAEFAGERFEQLVTVLA